MTRSLPAPRPLTRAIAIVAGIPFFALLGALTLSSARIEQRMPGLVDRLVAFLRHDLSLTWLGFTRLEILANVAVFVPVGVLAFILLPRRIWALSFVVGPALSALIELWQVIALPVRRATIADVLANSTGATIGVLAALLCTLLVHRFRSPTIEAS